MKKLEDFKAEMTMIRYECTHESRMKRVCAARIAPELDVFFGETESMAYECQANEDAFAMNRFCWMISSVADIFTEYKSNDVSDDMYALFQEYMAELSVLRGEIVKYYKEGHVGREEMLDRLLCCAGVIESANGWVIYRDFNLFDEPGCAYALFHKINTEWEELKARFGKVYRVIREFAKFKKYQSVLDFHYDDEALYNMLVDVLDGKKKLSSPIMMYKITDEVSIVVDADASDDVGLGVLLP